MSDFKKFSDLAIEKITYIENKLNIQWWLYRGLLSQQPLTLPYYHTWYENYNNFYTMVYNIEDNDIEVSLDVLIKQFETINNALVGEKDKLTNVLPKETYESVTKVFNKITESINSIIEIIRKERDKSYE